ncbi:hypothetical protein AV521_00855 [Streptomyces sp. IMTB 2501]|uniref:Lsr2 family protein n=1 Tax=Streptomyces sp. IMTB 2501 TaxID=1776340 RepID=UPI00096C7105|nr:Lsr2 family protein [Streptomyces sp. IMTB 2501]OLZ74273.1 hypothetical protein AV521_00855 [Streptomyces sp. IMTB 2501]
MRVSQLVELTVEGDDYEGKVEDAEVVANLDKLDRAYQKAREALLEALSEAGVVLAGTPAPGYTARPASAKKPSTSAGPDASDVRAWAATLSKPALPVAAQGRIPGWVNEAFEKKLKGEALDKHTRQHASADFLKKYDEVNKKK